jgi:hypothetical protein
MAAVNEVRRIAWSIYWKSVLLGVVLGAIAGFVVGFLFGMIGGLSGFERETVRLTSQWGGGLAGLAAGFWSLNFILARTVGKTIGGRRLELVDATLSGEGH